MHRHCFHGLAPLIHLRIFLQMPQVLVAVAQVWCSNMAMIARIARLGIHPWINLLSPNSKSPWKSLGDCCIALIPKRPCWLWEQPLLLPKALRQQQEVSSKHEEEAVTQRLDGSVLSAISLAELWKKNQRYRCIPPFIPDRSRFCPTWKTAQHWTHLGGWARTSVRCPTQITLPQFPYQQNEDVIMIISLLGALWTVISVSISSSKMKCVA